MIWKLEHAAILLGAIMIAGCGSETPRLALPNGFAGVIIVVDGSSREITQVEIVHNYAFCILSHESMHEWGFELMVVRDEGEQRARLLGGTSSSQYPDVRLAVLTTGFPDVESAGDVWRLQEFTPSLERYLARIMHEPQGHRAISEKTAN